MTTKKVLAIQLQVNGQQAQAALSGAQNTVRNFAASISRMGQQTVSSGASVLKVFTSWQSALVALVGTLSGLQLGAALTREAKGLDEFGEKLRQLGLQAEELSTLEFVADRINVPFDTLAESVSRANIALARMRREGRNALFGVSLRDGGGQSRDVLSVLQELGPAMQRMNLDTSSQQAMLAEAFGRQALNLDRLMNAGTLTRYRSELEKLGGPTLQRNIDAGIKVADALDDVAFAWKRVKQEGVVALAELTPAVEWLAQRLGSLPSSVQGFAAALGTAAGNGPNATEAQRNVMAFGRTIVDGMRESAMALASAVGTTAGAAFETAVAGLGPTLSDVAYEALAPILRKLPGVGDDKLPLSLSEQISQTRARLLQAEAAARRQDSGGWSMESRGYVQQGGILRRTAVGMELSEQTEVAGKARLLRLELQDLEAQASRQRQERLDTFFKTLGNGATVSAEAWKEAAAVIDGSWKRIETAAKGLGERYGDTVFGPPSSLARPSGASIFNRLMQDQSNLGMLGVFNSIGLAAGGRASLGGGEQDLRNVAFLRDRSQVMGELQARESIAFGGEANAARTRTQLAFEQQRQELFEKYGESARAILPTLERVQSIEQQRMSLDAKVTATLRELNEAQEQYNLSVAQRAQRVTAGLMTQAEARRADDVSAQALMAAQQQAGAELEQLQRDYPQFARLVQDTSDDVRLSLEQMALSLERVSRGDWRAGFRAGLEDIRLQAEDVFTFTRDLTTGVANTMASGFSTAFTNIVNGTSSVKDAFRDLASSVLNYIAQMTMQMLVFRAIAGIAGSFAGAAGGASGAGLGGAGNATASGMSIPSASRGLSVNSLLGPAGRFAMGAAFQGGEVVPFASGGVVTSPTMFPMSRGRTGLMGEAGPEAIVPLKRGRDGRLGVAGGSSVTIAPVINITVSGGGDTQRNQRVGREVAAAVVDAIVRDPDLRRAVRGA
jgi:lambda family phage tail tape measure protein